MNSYSVLKPYFQLQLTRLHRWMKEAGMPVWLGYVLGILFFIVGSIYLFSKTEWAAYVYSLLAVQVCLPLAETNRSTFLKLHYEEGDFVRLRRLENSFVVLPFVLFLIIKGAFLLAGFLLVFAFLLAGGSVGQPSNWVLPTPFSHRPFEFMVGFRRTWYLLLLAYGLVGIGVWVGNFNLGVVSIFFLFLVFLGYYAWQEPVVYVWYHTSSPAAFLRKKAKEAWIHSSTVVFPPAALLLFFFPSHFHWILSVLLIGYCLLGTVLLAKYAAYPASIGLKQGVVMALGLYPPILLILVAYYFYWVAKKQLNTQL